MAIAEMANEAFRQHDENHRDIHPREVSSWIKRGHLIKMVRDGRVVGCVLVLVHGRDRVAEMSQLAVHKELDRGQGPTLIKAAEEYARRAGCQEITLRVGPDTLLRWYSEHGYHDRAEGDRPGKGGSGDAEAS